MQGPDASGTPHNGGCGCIAEATIGTSPYMTVDRFWGGHRVDANAGNLEANDLFDCENSSFRHNSGLSHV